NGVAEQRTPDLLELFLDIARTIVVEIRHPSPPAGRAPAQARMVVPWPDDGNEINEGRPRGDEWPANRRWTPARARRSGSPLACAASAGDGRCPLHPP